MTELEINKLIHEKVMGLNWYPLPDELGLERHPLWPSYTSSWADYGPMLEECMKKEWFDAFLNSGYGVYEEGDNTVGLQTIRDIDIYYLNPLRGSIAIAEFVEANPGYFEEK